MGYAEALLSLLLRVSPGHRVGSWAEGEWARGAGAILMDIGTTVEAMVVEMQRSRVAEEGGAGKQQRGSNVATGNGLPGHSSSATREPSSLQRYSGGPDMEC
jgi:hypothetical protein